MTLCPDSRCRENKVTARHATSHYRYSIGLQEHGLCDEKRHRRQLETMDCFLIDFLATLATLSYAVTQ